MKQMIIVATMALAATGAVAQTSQSSSHNPVVKDSKPHRVATPALGHSSFTKDQVRGRLTKAGYTDISNLKGTKDGAWQASAMKEGKPVTVTLDYKGNITAQ